MSESSHLTFNFNEKKCTFAGVGVRVFSLKQKLTMKKLSFLAILILVPLFNGSAQDSSKIPAGISLAFKAGNASELANFFNPTVELLLLDKEDFYKKNVAESILSEFFKQYPAKDFTIRHQGAKNDALYAIGSLKTDKTSFRVYFLLKKTEEGLLIHQIRIDPDDGRHTTN